MKKHSPLGFILTVAGLSAFMLPVNDCRADGRPVPPVRPPDAPGTPVLTPVGAPSGQSELRGAPGANPPVDSDGDFLIGPDYVSAPETVAVAGVPKGSIKTITMRSEDSRIYPGITKVPPGGPPSYMPPDLTNVSSDCVVLTDVTIDEPEFVYETKVISSNIGDLLKNMQGTKANESQRAQPVDGHGKPLKFIVKHFSLTNGHVTLGIGPTALTLPMPPVTLDDVGTQEGGVSPAELALALMRNVTGGIVKATTEAAGKIGSTMGAAAGDTAKSAGDAIKDLFGGKK